MSWLRWRRTFQLKIYLLERSDEDHNIVKLGLMSVVAVFKDIIPGYRIRLPTEKELEMKVSKDVLQTRFYESTLLSSYKAYLQKLIAFEKDPSFHRLAVRCMCILLDAVPHFNFRENLVAVVVRNISSADNVVRKLCCETIKSVFTNEGKHGGQVTLEAVRLISDLVKAHDCQLHPDSIEVFLSLFFDEDLGKSEPKEEKREKLSKKKKRKQHLEQSNQLPMSEGKRRKHELMTKTREELSADLKSVSFAPDSDERRRTQSEILSAIFGTYFRILKHSMDPSFQRSMLNDNSSSTGPGPRPLLGPCLMGLGKFAHLIDLDFLGDLMSCLKKLAGYNESFNDNPLGSLSVSEKLQCCIVAFRVMRNNLDALNVDLQEFYVQLYNLLLEYRPFRDRGDVLAEALKTMLWEGKQHDMHRAAAFIKRLATFALSFGSSEAMAALVTLKHLLLRNSKCRSLLENDPGGGSLSGLVVKYKPEASDPHLSGALASVLWELSLVSKHHNPSISGMASGISAMTTMNPSQTQAYLSALSPVNAFDDSQIERELLKALNRKSSFKQRSKKMGSEEFVAIDAEKVRGLEKEEDEDVIERKFEEHFMVLRDIGENEKLRLELGRVSSALSLYEEYKQQRKPKQKKQKKQKKAMGKLKSSIKSIQESIISFKPKAPSCIHEAKTHSFRACTSSLSLHNPDHITQLQKTHMEDSPSCSSSSPFPKQQEQGCLPPNGRINPKRFFFSPRSTKSIMEEVKNCAPKAKTVPGSSFCEESEAIVMVSDEPYRDFRSSMMEMVKVHELRDWPRLQQLLHCYLRLNDRKTHKIIVLAFVDLIMHLMAHEELFSLSSAPLCFSLRDLEK
ncbi:nucleolar complex protein 3 homolog isoform X2 [Phalaenopsis equestris]|uniref:nucleolar complex protein 3 homolog isoform X2 n=1 Tax=Phalaenopsis equestris TaxID=78828 RepID=UPI0009E52EF1|nr:nucleolar complex protein 3 homolog isoform X2 [Phalaenopsis equestris]